MKTTARFEQAVKKLYTAFHNDSLNPECCRECAVGNILDRSEAWKHLSDHHGSLQLNYVGKVHQSFGRRFNGYTPLELLHIEATFLSACGYQLPLKGSYSQKKKNKDILFDALEAVFGYLCVLDGIKNELDRKTWLDYPLPKKPRTALAIGS